MENFELARILLAFFVGHFLTISGSLAQIVTHNNLASPSTLGFDGLVVVCIILAQLFLRVLPLPVGIEWISFSIFILFFVFIALFGLKKRERKNRFYLTKNIQLIILIGLGFNLFVGAIFSVIQFLFMSLNWEFPTGIWFGNFKYYSHSFLWPFVGCFLYLQFLLLKLSPSLRLLSIGYEFSSGIGQNVKKVLKTSLLTSLFLTGIVISFFGVFSFLGLVFPHMLRLFPPFKYNMRNELLYGSVITGVAFSILDYACYQFDLYGAELPVGMVSSVIGSFILLFLLIKTHLFKR